MTNHSMLETSTPRLMTAPRRERKNVSWLSTLGFFFLFFGSTNGQTVGVDICSCAPSTYEFTLDFSLFCPPVNITQGDAVAATTCMVSPFQDPSVVDLIPVAVQSIDILELDQKLNIIVKENIQGNFADGDTFSYSSVAAEPGEIIGSDDIPRAIQVNIIGVNQFDEPIISVYLLTFTNNCGAYPVFFEGQYAGWTRFTDLKKPIRDLCPASPPDSSPPTPFPTPFPTLLPTMPDMSMSMSMSMSMDMGLYFMDSVDEWMEFGRAGKKGRSGKKGSKKSGKKRKAGKKGFEENKGYRIL